MHFNTCCTFKITLLDIILNRLSHVLPGAGEAARLAEGVLLLPSAFLGAFAATAETQGKNKHRAKLASALHMSI